MIFGIPITPLWMIVGGVVLLALVAFEILLGLRKIKFGRRTLVYHKYIAFTILGVVIVHGLLGVLFVMGWSLL
jgi:hypothetical protein